MAWREPDRELAARNLALAYIKAGSEHNLPNWIVRGYRMLSEVQAEFPRDPAVFTAFGGVLLQGNQPQEAKIAFDRALALDPSDAINEENAGRADLACGNIEQATKHLENALRIDPLLLSSIALLEGVYQKQGETGKEAALAERIRSAMGSVASPRRFH
jgi:Tfp pilus assembly protein PilF